MISAEACYINTAQPDFLSGHKVNNNNKYTNNNE